MLRLAVLLLVLAALAACSTARETRPPRAATEQLLISTAADRAAARLPVVLPWGTRVYLDSSNFQGTDAPYAVGAIRDHLLRRGLRLMPSRQAADVVVEVRAGALSVDERDILVGVPAMNVPVPFAGGGFAFPEIALFKKAERQGVAKFAATAYGAEDGALRASTGPRYGFSNESEWVVLMAIEMRTSDLMPERPPVVPFLDLGDDQDEDEERRPPPP